MPQRPKVWELDEFEGGDLRFSYGFLGTAGDDLRFEAAIRKGDGKWDSVFEGDRGARPDTSAATWREVRVDLSANGPVSAVRFAVFPDDPEQRFAGIGVVANPTVIPPSTDSPLPNVLLISLDTLRADRLAPFGYHTSTSPILDSWATRSGVVFRNTVAPSPRTLPSHVSMLTGLNCLSHGVNHLSPAPPKLEMLAEILRRHGSATAGTVGGGLMNPNFGFAQGFGEFYHYPGWSGGFEELEVELDRALEKLSRVSDRPFFVFFHTYEIHDPFHERAPFSDACYSDLKQESARDFVYGELPRARSVDDEYVLYYDLVKWKRGEPISSAVPVDPGELDLLSCLYDSAISYADAQIDRLLSQLEDVGELENTLVIVTSDHGESLGEKGLFKHANLYENNLMVPLVFRFPGGRQGGQSFDRQVGTVDIVPTVLEYLGIDPPANLDGESLLPIIRGRGDGHRPEVWSYAAYENRGLSLRIENQIKYIFNNSAVPSINRVEEVYHLFDDTEELRNLVKEDPEASRTLRQRVSTYYRSRTNAANLVVENQGCEAVRGTIRLKSLITRLKAVDAVGGALNDVSDNRAGVRIGQGENLELFVDSSEMIEIDLEALGCSFDGSSTKLRRSIAVKGGDMGLFLGLTDSGWQEYDSRQSLVSAGTSARVILGGPVRAQESSRDPLDEDVVLELLRSLGYVH